MQIKTRSFRYNLVLILLLILFARLALEARRLSFTTDEPSHLASGYAYLSGGETWTSPLRGHPLLIDAWNALPIYIAEPNIPVRELNGWQEDNTRYVQSFSPYLATNVERHEIASRVPAMLITMILASVVTRWAWDLWGAAGGVFALLVLLFDPLVIGHGMLATNDVGVVSIGTLALYLTYRFSARKISAYNMVTLGFVYGLTMLAKGSGVIWFAGGILMMALRLYRRTTWKQALRSWIYQGAIVTAVALMAVWAFYGFEVGSGHNLPLPIPAPAHWESILMQSESPSDRLVYYLGRVHTEGWWGYFPLAFLLKNPLPFLILIGLGIVRRIQAKGLEDLMSLAIFPTLYAIIAIGAGLNIGYRHLLPVHPFLYLSAAAVITSSHLFRIAAVGLLGWMGLESILIAPHHIAYFNQAAGGSNQGWRYLADSNTDWGQGYKYLSDYLNNNPGLQDAPPYYSGPAGYLGLATYRIAVSPLPPLPSNPAAIMKPWVRPSPGRYIISANSLAGLGCTAPDNYAWFRFRKPDQVIGHILFVYDVKRLSEATWIAQCSKPIPPFQNEDISRAFPANPAREFAFDCTQSWVIPTSRTSYGWYVLHDEQMRQDREWLQRIGVRSITPADDFVARNLEALQVSYRQWEYRDIPAFVVYASPEDRTISGPAGHYGYPALAESIPSTLITASEAPLALEGPLVYLGAESASDSENIETTTWWRVSGSAPARPLSIMAHLLDQHGEVLGIADGLGIAPENWESGDVLLQRHHFPMAGGRGRELWLRTGIYWLDTGERWQIQAEGVDAVFVRLETDP